MEQHGAEQFCASFAGATDVRPFGGGSARAIKTKNCSSFSARHSARQKSAQSEFKVRAKSEKLTSEEMMTNLCC